MATATSLEEGVEGVVVGVENAPRSRRSRHGGLIQTRIRPLQPKDVRYAMLFKRKLESKYVLNRGVHFVYDDLGLKLSHNGVLLYECLPEGRLVKSAYFVFCLCEHDIAKFDKFLKVNHGAILDCGEISPETSLEETVVPPQSWMTRADVVSAMRSLVASSV